MIDILRKRRSIRRYENRPIDEKSVDILKEALLRSPSSRGINPWNFIFVTDPGLLKKLSAAKEHGAAFLSGASLGIIVCGDESKSDAWIEDCSIASIIVQLTAQSLKLGSCWIQIRNRKHSEDKTSENYIRELFNLPEHIRIESIISIGYPAESKTLIPLNELDYSKIRFDKES